MMAIKLLRDRYDAYARRRIAQEVKLLRDAAGAIVKLGKDEPFEEVSFDFAEQVIEVSEELAEWLETRGTPVRSPEAERAIRFAGSAFGAVLSLVPRRLSDEEIGDAIEFMRQQLEVGCPVWLVYVKVISTIFWVLINAVREVSSAFLGKTKKMG